MTRAFLSQVWVVTGVLLANLETGMFLGFTTCLLPALQEPDSPITASLEESSWIAASFSFAWIPGFLSSSYFMDRFGRKPAFILDMVPGAAGLVLVYFSTNVYCLIAARVLEGITAGGVTILGAIVIGEYSSPEHRGMFLNLKTAALYVGCTIVHLLGNYLHWRTLTLCILVPFLLNFGMIFTWHESPYWLATQKKFDRSRNIFYKLRGKTEASTKEIKEIIKAQQGVIKEDITVGKSILHFIKKFGKRNFLKPVLIYVFAAVLLETTGRHIFPAYAVQIMSEINGKNGSFYYTFALDILVAISATFSSVLIRLFKRRTLLFTTGFTSVIILLSSCLYIFLASRDIVPNIVWLPISLFGLYFAIVNFACAPIPLALIGELFPLEHKAAGTTIAGILIAIMSIVTLKTTPFFLAYFKVHGTFTILGVSMTISLFFLYFMLPETKDRTLKEIEDYFDGKSCKNDHDKDKEAGVVMIPLHENNN